MGAKSAQKTQAQWERIFGSEQAKDFYAKKSIRWRNTIERAPWYGGMYERLILEIKKSLRRSVGHKALLTLPQMRTVIVKIEGIVNSCPLTYMSDSDIKRPLRPIDFLIPGKNDCANLEMANPTPDSDPEDPDYCTPNDRASALQLWKKQSNVLEKFWRDWRENYLLSLRERKCELLSQRVVTPKIGEIVLIENEEMPRGTWQLGRIIE